ncbi:MAG: Dps family protein [Fidelibacterota bacterium]
MKPNIGVDDNNRDAVVDILNTLLSDETVLYIRTRNYHWNVVGPQFNDLHQFFEGQYGVLEGIIDDVAERARTLGGRALGTMEEFSRRARLKEAPGEYPDDKTMLRTLLSDHEEVARNLRVDARKCSADYGDSVTGEFLNELAPKHEKMAWMLRSLLEE